MLHMNGPGMGRSKRRVLQWLTQEGQEQVLGHALRKAVVVDGTFKPLNNI